MRRVSPLVLALREVTHCFEQLQMEGLWNVRWTPNVSATRRTSNGPVCPYPEIAMIGTAGSPPQFSDDFQPVLFGQQHVQDNHVHGCCLGALHSLAAIAGLDSLVSSRLSSWRSTSRVGASSSIISTRAMVHLSYTARRTILCRITNPKQSKNDAKCTRTESMKHIKGYITVRPSFCHVLVHDFLKMCT